MAVVLAMLCGIALGFLFPAAGRGSRLHRLLSMAQLAGAALLLFCIGLWLGGDPQFLRALRTAGATGIAIALAGTAASVVCAWLLARFMRKHR